MASTRTITLAAVAAALCLCLVLLQTDEATAFTTAARTSRQHLSPKAVHNAKPLLISTSTRQRRLQQQQQQQQQRSSSRVVLKLSERVSPTSNGTAIAVPIDNGESSLANGGIGDAITRLGLDKNAPTVWTEFSRIAQEHKVEANLGQGFPDWAPPPFATASLVEAATQLPSAHQYTRTAGHANLIQQLARRYGAHLRQEIEPFSEVAVTVGASQALYLALQTIIKEGDEVILFEPFFDLYVSQVKLAGGIPVYVPLRFVPYDDSEDVITGGEWVLDPQVLQQQVNPRTKAIILNSPHNPTGKIFTRDEMEHVAAALELASPDCVVLSDEVYKYIVHSPPAERAPEESLFCRGHVHFASLPGMWDRTITISSAGKTFSATGWQIGWCIGPRHLIAPIHQLLPYVQFCASTVMQEALARSLPRADEPYEGYESYYDYLRNMYKNKRDQLAAALQQAGFAVPDYTKTAGGGFFILARIGKSIRDQIPAQYLNAPNDAAPGGIARQDWALCQWLAQERGLLCIPSSPFFSRENAIEGASDEFVRIAFCKTDETIQAAAKALAALHVDNDDNNVINAVESSSTEPKASSTTTTTR